MSDVYTPAFIGVISQLLFSILGPVLVLIIWKLRTKTSVVPALIGASAFILFALVFEQFLHSIILGNSSPILSNPLLYSLYAGVSAGIFEETGRFISFKFFLKSYNNKRNAITYGIGHAGIEIIFIMGLTAISNIIILEVLASGSLNSLTESMTPEAMAAINDTAKLFEETDISVYFLGITERIFAFISHVSMSILVFAAVHHKNLRYLFPCSILMHAILNFPAGLYQSGVLNIYITEIIIMMITGAFAFIALRVYRNHLSN